MLAKDIPPTNYRKPGTPFVWFGSDEKVELSPTEIEALARYGPPSRS